MGRITIFTAEYCDHCHRAKCALEALSLPYTEICISSYPEKRSDMLKMSNRLTVPQVFVNERHVGGADETLVLLEQWKKEAIDTGTTVLERYQQEIEFSPDPVDPRLAVPDVSLQRRSLAVSPPPAPIRDIELPDKSMVSIYEVTKLLMEIMPRADLPYLARVYKDCFVGSDGVSALQQHFQLENREAAVQFGYALQRKQILHHVVHDHNFGDSWYYYRLQAFHQPHILNSFFIWTHLVDPNPMAVLKRLRRQLGKLLSSHTNEEGQVDYIAAFNDPNYQQFEHDVCELQGISIGSMDESTKLAFCINLYNMMIKHAFVKVGTAGSSSAFFKGVHYNVGGNILSLDDVEHGIIRANTRHPYGLSEPFSKADQRQRLPCKTLDARIHFALNCGAKSCPPINNFTAEAIEEELRLVAMAYCEHDDNVSMDEEKNELCLSMLFKWYAGNFLNGTKKTMPQVVVTYLRGTRQQQLQRMIDSKKPISLTYKPYDWKTNASNSLTFDANRLDPNQVTAKALWSNKEREQQADRRSNASDASADMG